MERTRRSKFRGTLATRRSTWRSSRTLATRARSTRETFPVRRLALTRAGYAGYVKGVKSENLIGQTYAKLSVLSQDNAFHKGMDQPAGLKFMSVNQENFVNQQELKKRNALPPAPAPMTVDDLPDYVKSEFYGVSPGQVDRYTKSEIMERDIASFYRGGDGGYAQGTAADPAKMTITMSYSEALKKATQ